MTAKIIVVYLRQTPTQTQRFQAFRPVGVIAGPQGQIGIVGEVYENSAVETCKFTMVRPGETVDLNKVGGRLGVTPAGAVIYGSCFTNA